MTFIIIRSDSLYIAVLLHVNKWWSTNGSPLHVCFKFIWLYMIYIYICPRLGIYCSYSTNVSTMASHREHSSIFLGFPLPRVCTFSWLKRTICLLRHRVGNVAVRFSKVSNSGNWALNDHLALWLTCRSLGLNMAKHQPGAFATLWHLMRHWNKHQICRKDGIILQCACWQLKLMWY